MPLTAQVNSFLDLDTTTVLNTPRVFRDSTNPDNGITPSATDSSNIVDGQFKSYAFFAGKGTEIGLDLDGTGSSFLDILLLDSNGTLITTITNGAVNINIAIPTSGLYYAVVVSDDLTYNGNFTFSGTATGTHDYDIYIDYQHSDTSDTNYTYTETGDDDDFLSLGVAGDFVNLEGGDDIIYANDDNDVVTSDGVSGDKVIYGQSGNDVLEGALTGSDRVFGGSGDDVLLSGLDVALFFPGAGDDYLDGGSGNDLLVANSGDDQLFGGDGNDELFGNSGDDLLSGGDNEDSLFGGEGADHLDGGFSNDFLDAGAGDDYALGGSGSDTILLGAGDDMARGESGNDWIYGEGGRDQLSGGSGGDRLDGGADYDWMWGGSSEDWFHFAGFAFHDFIMDFVDGEDKIDLQDEGWGYTSTTGPGATAGGGTLTIVDDGNGNAFISLGYQTWITVYNISAAQLTDADFNF